MGKRFVGLLRGLGLCVALLTGSGGGPWGLRAHGAPLTVCATVGMVADLARGVGGQEVVVEGLMGPGVDPHLYKATSSDLIRLQRAEVILYSGLHLEGKMQETFQRLSRSGRRVRAVTDGLPPERLIRVGKDGIVDPHVWFDVELWSRCIEGIAEEFAAARPDSAAGFRHRAATVKQELKDLHQWVLMRVATVPKPRRILVTSHDAFGYFGQAYGFQVVALQGISTVTEAGLADMTQLTDFIRSKGVPAVFVESSVSHASLERIRQDAGVKLGGELFSDAMGTPGQRHGGYDLGTYQGMIRQNVDRIVEGLK